MKILLFKGRGIISKLIAWQTRGKYSHAALLIDHDLRIEDPETGKVIVYKAGTIIESWGGSLKSFFRRGGVRKLDGLKDWDGVDTFSVPELTPEMELEGMLWLHDVVKRKVPYDFKGVWRFVKRTKTGDLKKLFCSELDFEYFLKFLLFLNIVPFSY